MWFRASDARHSLRRRLLALVLAAVAAASVLQGASTYRTAVRNANALFDGQLQALAHAVQAGLPAGGGEPFDFNVQIWGADGVLQFGTRVRPLPAPVVLGFSEVVADGVPYRVYSLNAAGRRIQIAQDLNARRDRAQALAVDAVLPVAALGLLLMLAVWLVIDRSLAPISRLRQQLASRAGQNLAPLSEQGLPDEVLPMVRELNQLFGRVEQAFRSQQQFVADAAHELRSPLAALKLQAQTLQRQQQPAAESLLRLLQGIDRAAALVAQLLALAREEGADDTDAKQEHVDLHPLVREVVADLLAQATARGIDLGMVPGAEHAVVRGERESLRTLLRNLLENAVKFTPEGGQVDITLAPDRRGCTLLVEDSGPGIPEQERTRVFDRFYRAAAVEAPGSGLGLSIVGTIARRHGARVALDTSPRLGGLRVTVQFGIA